MEKLWGIPNYDIQETIRNRSFSFEKTLGSELGSTLDKLSTSSVAQTTIKVIHLIVSLTAYGAFSRAIGTFRILTGVVMIMVGAYTATVKLEGDAEKEKNATLRKVVSLATGLIVRGSLEAFIPFGLVLNAIVDLTKTCFDCFLLKETSKTQNADSGSSACSSSSSCSSSSLSSFSSSSSSSSLASFSSSSDGCRVSASSAEGSSDGEAVTRPGSACKVVEVGSANTPD